MKIAIVGSGISGNVVASLLHRDNEIELFEAEPRLGGHARTITVNTNGQSFNVDTGFMVFNEKTYPNFCKLLRSLNVTAQDTEMSFGVRCDLTKLEYQGSSLGGLFAQKRNIITPRFLKLLNDIFRFNRDANAILEGERNELTLRELLLRNKYSPWLFEKYLVPMTAAIWSCPPGLMLDFPLHFLLGFLKNHGLLQIFDRPQWKTIRGTSKQYVEKLTAPFRDRIRLNCPVESIRRQADGVAITLKTRETKQFDHVVLACHADLALSMIADADTNERMVLSSFPYQENTAVVHTDCSVLPRRQAAWANWNYRISEEVDQNVMVTYNLSGLQKVDSPTPILLSLNTDSGIDESKVLNTYRFRHPVFSSRSLAAQKCFEEINFRRRISFCGAYWGYGFHEDGVNSALAVARNFGQGSDAWKAAST